MGRFSTQGSLWFPSFASADNPVLPPSKAFHEWHRRDEELSVTLCPQHNSFALLHPGQPGSPPLWVLDQPQGSEDGVPLQQSCQLTAPLLLDCPTCKGDDTYATYTKGLAKTKCSEVREAWWGIRSTSHCELTSLTPCGHDHAIIWSLEEDRAQLSKAAGSPGWDTRGQMGQRRQHSNSVIVTWAMHIFSHPLSSLHVSET